MVSSHKLTQFSLRGKAARKLQASESVSQAINKILTHKEAGFSFAFLLFLLHFPTHSGFSEVL